MRVMKEVIIRFIRNMKVIGGGLITAEGAGVLSASLVGLRVTFTGAAVAPDAGAAVSGAFASGGPHADVPKRWIRM